MIRISKLPKPQILIDNEEHWNREYQNFKVDPASVPKAAATRYTHADIKTALRTESFDKCVYCESKVSHTFPGETDHIIPLSVDHTMSVTWENLCYSCKECNRRKSNYYNRDLPIVNPFVDEPSDHFDFYGPLPIHKNTRGKLTITKLELARAALYERRKERIESVTRLIDLWKNCTPGPERDALRDEVLSETEPTREFSATIRDYLRCRSDW